MGAMHRPHVNWRQLSQSSRLWRARAAALAGAVLLGLVAIAFARFGDAAQQGFITLYRRYPMPPSR
jgi:anti-sigma-K factor RskA